MSDILACIPTYNEAQNIGALVELILSTEKEIHVLVVDDNSPDGTARVVEKLQATNPEAAQRVFLLKRTQNKGFANSYRDGFRWAYDRGYQYLVQMDADFSHHPRYLSSLISARKQYDLVCGSRYCNGGKIVNWPLKRRLLSACGNLYVRMWLGCPIRDMTTGFNVWSLAALKKVNLQSLKSDGYSFLIELKFFSTKAGLTSAEMQIVFEDRKAQESKMSGSIFKEAVIQVPLLRLKNIFRSSIVRPVDLNAQVDSTVRVDSIETVANPESTESEPKEKRVVGFH